MGPAILFLLWEYATPRQAARAGFLFGVALFGAGTWWIFTAVYEFGGTPIWLAIFIMVVVLAIKGRTMHALLAVARTPSHVR